jgi:hypothetical protein
VCKHCVYLSSNFRYACKISESKDFMNFDSDTVDEITACMCVRARLNASVCVSARACTCESVCKHVQMCVCVQLYASARACVHVCFLSTYPRNAYCGLVGASIAYFGIKKYTGTS